MKKLFRLNNKFLCFLLIAVLVTLCTYAVFVQGGQNLFLKQSCVLTIQQSGQCIALEKATTDKQHVQGLSGRKFMADTQGMLFVFDKPAKPCFWMKDMHFGLDMIWLDANKKVVQIDNAVAPESYPNKFCPNKPAQYVIEVNDGIAEQAGLWVGQTLKL